VAARCCGAKWRRVMRDPGKYLGPRGTAALTTLHQTHSARRTSLTLFAEGREGVIATALLSVCGREGPRVDAGCGCTVSWTWPVSGFDPRYPGRLANKAVVGREGARAALYCGRALVGLLALEPEAPAPSGGAMGLAPSTAALEQLATAVMEDRPGRSGGAAFVLGPDGLVCYEPAAQRWATPELATHLWSECYSGRPTVAAVGSHQIELTPLMSAAGDCALCVVRPCPSFLAAADAGLSPRQREIARLAAEGCTISDLAALTGCRVETVKTHLRAIYQTLGVSSRVELRKVLELQ